MTTTPAPTQADRESAAKWAKKQGRHAQAANILRGSCDNAPLVQAFMNHRLQAEARMSRMREALEGVEDRAAYASNMFHDSTRWHSESAQTAGLTLWDWIFAPARAALNDGGGE